MLDCGEIRADGVATARGGSPARTVGEDEDACEAVLGRARSSLTAVGTIEGDGGAGWTAVVTVPGASSAIDRPLAHPQGTSGRTRSRVRVLGEDSVAVIITGTTNLVHARQCCVTTLLDESM